MRVGRTLQIYPWKAQNCCSDGAGSASEGAKAKRAGAARRPAPTCREGAPSFLKWAPSPHALTHAHTPQARLMAPGPEPRSLPAREVLLLIILSPTPIFCCFFLFIFLFFSFMFISWKLIALQYCSGFCHTLTWISHGFTCVPHPDPPSHLPPHPILWVFPVHQARAPVSCIQPGLVICFTLDSILVSMLFSHLLMRNHLGLPCQTTHYCVCAWRQDM